MAPLTPDRAGRPLVLRGDARNLPLPDASVDLVVTSPPYFALRSYTDGGEHYAGQIGAEPTPAEYIAALVECTREWVRVLKPSGSIFVNLGDKYNSAASGQQSTLAEWSAANARGGGHKPAKATPGRGSATTAVGPKSLMMLPERYRIACVDTLGLIARAVVIWSKPNGLPESVTDRVRRSHEDWVHLTVRPRYYSAVDHIRESYDVPPQLFRTKGKSMNGGKASGSASDNVGGVQNPLGKLPGSVWTIPTEPLKVPDHLGVDHFAAFPTEWPRRIIAGWSPSGICTACGEGRRPVAVAERTSREALRPVYGAGNHGKGGSTLGPRGVVATITGEACACPDTTAPTRPSVVLDPFGGTGTTALVAAALGRVGVTVDRSADYCRLAAWRTTDPAQRAKALRVAKPPLVADDQPSLFEVAS